MVKVGVRIEQEDLRVLLEDTTLPSSYDDLLDVSRGSLARALGRLPVVVSYFVEWWQRNTYSAYKGAADDNNVPKRAGGHGEECG